MIKKDRDIMGEITADVTFSKDLANKLLDTIPDKANDIYSTSDALQYSLKLFLRRAKKIEEKYGITPEDEHFDAMYNIEMHKEIRDEYELKAKRQTSRRYKKWPPGGIAISGYRKDLELDEDTKRRMQITLNICPDCDGMLISDCDCEYEDKKERQLAKEHIKRRKKNK